MLTGLIQRREDLATNILGHQNQLIMMRHELAELDREIIRRLVDMDGGSQFLRLDWSRLLRQARDGKIS